MTPFSDNNESTTMSLSCRACRVIHDTVILNHRRPVLSVPNMRMALTPWRGGAGGPPAAQPTHRLRRRGLRRRGLRLRLRLRLRLWLLRRLHRHRTGTPSMPCSTGIRVFPLFGAPRLIVLRRTFVLSSHGIAPFSTVS